MKWKKLGLIFSAECQNSLMVSGGRSPVPFCLGDDLYRIYFASYDDEGRGRIFSLEININEPLKINSLQTSPCVDMGSVGFYDDNGIIPSAIVPLNGAIYLYTIGFSLKNKVIFDAASGLAISRDGGITFDKLAGPVLDRGVNDPCFAASPCVVKEDDIWRMWYVSCDHWELVEGGFKHYYNIKHRTSTDGVYWTPRATTCINYANQYEYAISRPSVLREQTGLYRMWYSFRGQKSIATYRIGYAESLDGIKWNRMDNEAGIDVSKSGWDSEMICYPCVFEHKGLKYMLYNGNGYGRTGFGLAVLEEES